MGDSRIKNAKRNIIFEFSNAIVKNILPFISRTVIILPNNSANINSNDYDYIENAEIIQNSAKSIQDYLLRKAEMYPEFRSSVTGYSFVDLANIYSFINDAEVSALYSSILEGRYTKDNNVLLKKEQNKIDDHDLNLKNLGDKSARLLNLINNYSQKGINSTSKETQDNTNRSDGSQVIEDVETHDNISMNVTTTYDDLLHEYVLINQEIRYNQIDKEHAEYIKSIFAQNTRNSVLSSEIEQKISELVDELNEEYKIVYATARELNEYIGANYLKPLNSITTSEKVNIKLYIILALVLFFVVGCLGAIVIGRVIDFIEYILYTDKKTKLPNRQMCDRHIEVLNKNVLNDDFSFVLIVVTSLTDVNQKLGREIGDNLLAQFGQILKDAARNYGFVGYNGANQFIALLDNCDAGKCQSFIQRLENSTAKYNEMNVDAPITLKINYLNSKRDKIYNLRELIGKTFSMQ